MDLQTTFDPIFFIFPIFSGFSIGAVFKAYLPNRSVLVLSYHNKVPTFCFLVLFGGSYQSKACISIHEELIMPVSIHVASRVLFQRVHDAHVECCVIQRICLSKFFLVSLRFFLCHIFWSRTEQLSGLYIATNVH